MAFAWSVQTGPAHADLPPPSADELFERGHRLAREGRCVEAVPFFERSAQLDVAVGTLLNLAHCYELLDRAASAHRTFSRAARLASSRADPREREATMRAAALEPKRSYLVIQVAAPIPRDVALRVDGQPVETERWNLPIDVDAGEHTVEAEAMGYERHSARVRVGSGGARVAYVVPVLRRVQAPDTLRGESSSFARTTAYVALGLGGASLLAGTGIGIWTIRENDVISDRCGTSCKEEPEYRDRAEGVRTAATLSTISVVAGVVLVATGLALAFAASKR